MERHLVATKPSNHRKRYILSTHLMACSGVQKNAKPQDTAPPLYADCPVAASACLLASLDASADQSIHHVDVWLAFSGSLPAWPPSTAEGLEASLVSSLDGTMDVQLSPTDCTVTATTELSEGSLTVQQSAT